MDPTYSVVEVSVLPLLLLLWHRPIMAAAAEEARQPRPSKALRGDDRRTLFKEWFTVMLSFREGYCISFIFVHAIISMYSRY